MQVVQIGGVDEPPVVVPRLLPRVRKQNEHARQTGRREARQQGADVIAQDPDIGELPPIHLAQQGDHAVNERLGADQSDIRVRGRLRRQMFAATKADL